MTKYIYNCPKCGSQEVYVKPNGQRIAVHCLECNSWVCWCTDKVAHQIHKDIEKEVLNQGIKGKKVAFKKIKKSGTLLTMYCSECDCLLYSSLFKNVEGQFNLLNAKFCPKCGKELI